MLRSAWSVMIVLLMGSLAQGEIVTQTVEYEHDGVALRGFVAYDDAQDGRRPGVLVVHEWWGQNGYVKARAKQLAELGYVAFAADMYGESRITDDPQQAGEWAGALYADRKLLRGRALAGLEAMKELEQVDPEKVAAMGYCFGGTVALELARGGADIDAAISFHGGLKTDLPAREGEVKAKVLVLHGAADPMVPPEEVRAFQEEMHVAKADWVLIAYADAVHSFTSKEADARNMPGAKYNARADERSWRAMKDFLVEAFED